MGATPLPVATRLNQPRFAARLVAYDDSADYQLMTHPSSHPSGPLVQPESDAPLRIGVTGGRDFDDWNLVARVLDSLPDSVLVHGAASGTDEMCARWWTRMLQRVDEPHPADWRRTCDSRCAHRPRTDDEGITYCPAAGPLRNQEMVDSGLDLLIVFPGGRGTADMVRRARTAEVPTVDAATLPLANISETVNSPFPLADPQEKAMPNDPSLLPESSGQLKTPAGRARAERLVIVDPDGWRNTDDAVNMTGDSPSRTSIEDLLSTIRTAISDPGQFVRRANNYTEPVPAWAARAVLACLPPIARIAEDTKVNATAPPASEPLAWLSDPGITAENCPYGPHRGPQGPNEDLAQCFHCGTISHRMRPWGDTFCGHLDECGLPIWHASLCAPAELPHPTSTAALGGDGAQR